MYLFIVQRHLRLRCFCYSRSHFLHRFGRPFQLFLQREQRECVRVRECVRERVRERVCERVCECVRAGTDAGAGMRVRVRVGVRVRTWVCVGGQVVKVGGRASR